MSLPTAHSLIGASRRTDQARGSVLLGGTDGDEHGVAALKVGLDVRPGGELEFHGGNEPPGQV